MPEIINNKNEATFKMIEKDLLNTLQNNTAQSLDEIKKKTRNLLDYYVGRKTLSKYKINENIAGNGKTTFQILVEDPIRNQWTYTFHSVY